MADLNGRCMCGAVTVRATADKPILRACHCDMCRRWGSSMFMSLPTDPESVEVEGPVRIFRSSDWAERAFCETCGSSLWYMALEDQVRQLAAGLFDDAAGNTLKLEIFADRTPKGYAFSGEHRRLSEAECLDLFAPKDKAGDKA
ncbi:GFA family protein [Sedimentitalea todarodis]|uniref:GFA family protein n=1 Tax=Sedimentitalea todarodis TaxID=1631240 RepID=A0ABU3VIS3_9RHOB|nr:GFA family protein [Sedimentitalea todarodis]MDU9006078.1 GFA family protein [Sedimentitalea todarodis]